MNANSDVLEGLEAAVNTRQNEDLQSILDVERAQFAALMVTLIALGAIAVFIFLPMERRIRQEDATLRFEIAERQRAEKALRDSQLIYEQLATQMPKAGVIMFDREVRYTFAEGPFLRRLGFESEKLLGKTPEEVLPAVAASALRPIYESALRGEEIEFERETPDYSYQSICAPIRDIDDKIVGGMLLSLDITARHRAEKSLRENEERLRLITSNILDIVIQYSKDDTAVYMSPSMKTILGYNPEDYLGKPLLSLVHPEDLEATEGAYRYAVQNKHSSMNIETRLQDSLGKPVWFEVIGSLLYDDAGDYNGTVFVLRDSTERYYMEQLMVESEGLRVALEKEQELNDLKNAMMIRVAHEFRTPLAIISLANDMIERYYQRMTDEKREAQVSQIRAQIAHITDMLSSISFVVRPQEEKPREPLMACDLAQLSNEVIGTIQQVAGNKRTIVLDVDEASYRVFQDLDSMKILLQNALSNAIKFSTSTIYVRLKHDLNVQAVIVSLQDEGIGIPPNEISRLAEPFFRGSNIGEVPGLGLGMTIMNRILEAIGGAWQVESEVDNGTTLRLTIPAQRQKTGHLAYTPPSTETLISQM